MSRRTPRGMLVAMAIVLLCLGPAIIARAQTSGTFTSGAGCFDVGPAPGEIPRGGSFNCVDGGLFQSGTTSADDVIVLGSYSSSPAVGFGSLPDLGYNPVADPDAGVNQLGANGLKGHTPSMYQNIIDFSVSAHATSHSL